MQTIKWFQYKELNSSTWYIDGILADTMTPDQNGPGSNSNEGELHILKTPELEPHHQIVYCHI